MKQLAAFLLWWILAAPALAQSSAPVTSTVTVSAAPSGNAPILTGAQFHLVTTPSLASGSTVGTLSSTVSNLTGCTLSGDTAANFSVSLNGSSGSSTGCTIK